MKTAMKVKLGIFALALSLAVVCLTGCTDNGGNNGGGNNGTNNFTGTNAPLSVAGKSISHTITSGVAPFMTTGAFVLHAGGLAGGTFGNYTITGSAGFTNSMGTYTYVMTSANTALLILNDTLLGEVTETLAFQTPFFGTFASSIPSGSTQSGQFSTN